MTANDRMTPYHRPLVVGAFLEVTNADVRVLAELAGREAREAFDADDLEFAAQMNVLSDRLLAKAAQMDREADRG